MFRYAGTRLDQDDAEVEEHSKSDSSKSQQNGEGRAKVKPPNTYKISNGLTKEAAQTAAKKLAQLRGESQKLSNKEAETQVRDFIFCEK